MQKREEKHLLIQQRQGMQQWPRDHVPQALLRQAGVHELAKVAPRDVFNDDIRVAAWRELVSGNTWRILS